MDDPTFKFHRRSSAMPSRRAIGHKLPRHSTLGNFDQLQHLQHWEMAQVCKGHIHIRTRTPVPKQASANHRFSVSPANILHNQRQQALYSLVLGPSSYSLYKSRFSSAEKLAFLLVVEGSAKLASSHYVSLRGSCVIKWWHAQYYSSIDTYLQYFLGLDLFIKTYQIWRDIPLYLFNENLISAVCATIALYWKKVVTFRYERET